MQPILEAVYKYARNWIPRKKYASKQCYCNGTRSWQTTKTKERNLLSRTYVTHCKLKVYSGQKWHQYITVFEAGVINDYNKRDCQETIAEKYCVDQSQILRWIKNRTTIMQDAASSHRKLYRKDRKAIKYIHLYEMLCKELQQQG